MMVHPPNGSVMVRKKDAIDIRPEVYYLWLRITSMTILVCNRPDLAGIETNSGFS